MTITETPHSVSENSSESSPCATRRRFFDTVSIEQPRSDDLRLFLRTRAVGFYDQLELATRHVADANGDGVVNQADADLVLANFGQAGTLLAGDANTDGIVNFSDLNLVLANLGVSYALEVPAPGALAAVLLPGVAGLARRRRA